DAALPRQPRGARADRLPALLDRARPVHHRAQLRAAAERWLVARPPPVRTAPVPHPSPRPGGWRWPRAPPGRPPPDAARSARRTDITLRISGKEPLSLTLDSIVAEAACTSTQFHLLVSPDRYASYWNAAQLVAGPQLALGANSPFLFGHHLQAETRIETFLQ